MRKRRNPFWIGFVLSCLVSVIGCGGGEEGEGGEDGDTPTADASEPGGDAAPGGDPAAGGDSAVSGDPFAGAGGEAPKDGEASKTPIKKLKKRPPRERKIPRERVWTDASGRTQFKAKFLRAQGDKAFLQTPDGKRLVKSFSELSKYDLSHLYYDLEVKKNVQLMNILGVKPEPPKKKKKEEDEDNA